MKTAVAIALAAAEAAYAHTTFQSFVIDGTNAGTTGVQVPSNGNNPIYDVTSTAMICNGGTASTDFVEVKAGSKLGLQWHHNTGAPTGNDPDEPIAASHKGPVMVYVAPAESKGEGEVWIKIQEDGLTGTTWGVDNFITNKGIVEVTVPDLADGDYYIRPEMIGLHEASTAGKAQFYNGCGQIRVTGGSTTLPSGVDLTKAYSAQDPGVLCNIYGGTVSCTEDGSAGYTIPGPAVWDGASSGSGSGSAPAPSASASAPAASSAAPTPTATGAASSAPAQPSQTPAIEENTQEGSGSTLPETFTISEFISWLQTTTGSSDVAKRFARAFGRREHARSFA